MKRKENDLPTKPPGELCAKCQSSIIFRGVLLGSFVILKEQLSHDLSEQIPTEYLVVWIMAAPLFATTTTTTTDNNSSNNHDKQQQQQQKRPVQQPQQPQQHQEQKRLANWTAVFFQNASLDHLKIVQGSEGCERLHPVSTLADGSWRFGATWWRLEVVSPENSHEQL